MDLSHPTRSVMSPARAEALTVLTHAGVPLSGRQIAALVTSAKQWRVNEILRELAADGLVLRHVHPPAHLYTLNRDHVAAAPIAALLDVRAELIRRMRSHVEAWNPPPIAVWTFGSFARRSGGAESDIDILVIHPDGTVDSFGGEHVVRLAERVRAWSGNACEVLELTETELGDLVHNQDRLVDDLRRDAIPLLGLEPRHLLMMDDAGDDRGRAEPSQIAPGQGGEVLDGGGAGSCRGPVRFDGFGS